MSLLKLHAIYKKLKIVLIVNACERSKARVKQKASGGREGEYSTQIGKAKHFKHPNMLAIGEKKRMII